MSSDRLRLDRKIGTLIKRGICTHYTPFDRPYLLGQMDKFVKLLKGFPGATPLIFLPYSSLYNELFFPYHETRAQPKRPLLLRQREEIQEVPYAS
jgi:hypothetical protein